MSTEIIEETMEISEEEFEELAGAIEAEGLAEAELSDELDEEALDSVTGGFAISAATATIIAAIIGGGVTLVGFVVNRKKTSCTITYKKKGKTYKKTVYGKKAEKLCR